MKTCTKCKEVKTVDCFGKHATGKDGLRSSCKECRVKDGVCYRSANKEKISAQQKQYRLDSPDKAKASSKKYYEANKEKKYEYTRQWKSENKEKANASSKRYQLENKEKVKESKERYRKANIEKIREYQKQYCSSNPDKYKNYCNTRRARKLENGVYQISTKELNKLYESPCVYCGSIKQIEADHVIPLVRGGRHSIGNLVPACRSCNASKHSKLLVEWRRSLAWVS